MQAIRQTLNDYKPNGIATSSFKADLALFLMTEPILPDNECILGLQEDLTAESILSDEIINGSTTLFCILHGYVR